MTMGTPIDRARKYMKLLRRLIKQEHLYTEEKIIETDIELAKATLDGVLAKLAKEEV